MKKTLALVLAFALVFSTMTVAFAEDAAIGADAKVCSDLGMLKGATGTVDAAYLATVPNRLQAAVMFLRLKGLEAEANAFTGTDNFSDASKATWGQPVMAYLKAHPELGFEGNPDGTFNPAGAMTAQAYYKVMLTALGYKQNTATVVGDFTWENVITFAAGKGLTKVAAVTNFTVNDLAVATVEALKANVKDTTKTLAATLVEAGKLDKAMAIAAGVYVDNATTTAALDTVVASANDKVEVTFDADAAKEYAENVANYKIVVKGSTTALEVKAARAVSSTVVELTTAAQGGGTAYTMTVGGVSVNFPGLAKSTAAPEIDTVNCIDTNTVEVVFTKGMDRASAEDIANYTLTNGATVKKAELWVDQDDTRKTVKLTTDGVANNKIYKLTIANVKSADLVAIKSASKSFSGITDTTAAKINGNIVVKNNQRFWVYFTDAHGVDKATAENIANWSIDGLTITKITAKDNDLDTYGYYELVEVDTEPMTPSQKYTVTISNLADGSYAKNVIAKTLSKTFSGVAVDKTAPKPGRITVYGDNMVEIDFSSEANRLDVATATDINNYTFNEGLKVLSASILRSSKPDTAYGKTVVLTTSTMDTATTYKITMENVADEFGNVMAKVSNRAIERSNGTDVTPPAILKTQWVDLTTVDLTFDERLDIDSAQDIANYSISGGLGAVKKAEIWGSAGYTKVTLTTAKQEENKAYTITINGVKDRLGNVCSSYAASFISSTDGIDTTRPEIEDIQAVSDSELRVTFNEPVVVTPAAHQLEVTLNDDNDSVDTNEFTATAVGNAGAYATSSSAFPAGYTIDGGRTVVFKTSANMAVTSEFTIFELSGIKDVHGNTFLLDSSDLPSFYGNTTDEEAAELVTKDQVDVRTLQFTFDQPILAPSTITATVGNTTQLFNVYYGFDALTSTKPTTIDDLSTITLVKANSGALTYEADYKFDFSAVLTDYLGNAVEDEGTPTTGKTTYRALMEDEDAPVIDFVEAVDINTIKVTYNENLNTTSGLGTYVIQEDDGTAISGMTYSYDYDNDNEVLIDIPSNKLTAGEVYKLVPKTAATDLAGNKSSIKDVSFDFVASGLADSTYITGVRVVNAKNIIVYTNKVLSASDDIQLYILDSNGDPETLVQTWDAVASTKNQIVMISALKDDGVTDYGIMVVNGANTVCENHEFDVAIGDGGIDIASDIVTFSGWDATNYVVTLVYDGDEDGYVTSNEVYFVMPSYNVAGSVYEFNLNNAAVGATVYQLSDTTQTLDYTTMTYGYDVDVYRLNSEIDMSAIADENDYQSFISANMESVILYSIEY